MKKLAIFVLAALLATSLVACKADGNDLNSINDYIAPSYTEKVATGTLTFAEGVGESAIITDLEFVSDVLFYNIWVFT